MTDIKSASELAEEGKRYYQLGDYTKAAECFTSAAQTYTAQDEPLMTAEMKNNLCVVLLQARKLNDALEAVTGTDAIFAAQGDFRRQGMACANRAMVLNGLGRWKDAIPVFEQAAEVLEKAGEDEMRADTLKSLSQLYMGYGRFTDAMIAMQEGLRGVKNPSPRQKFLKKIIFRRLWK